MKKTRTRYTPEFKARVAIEALKERETMSELVSKFKVHANQINRWKREFISRSSEIFSTKPPKEDFEKERAQLYAKIGELEMEKDWLKKKSWKGVI